MASRKKYFSNKTKNALIIKENIEFTYLKMRNRVRQQFTVMDKDHDL